MIQTEHRPRELAVVKLLAGLAILGALAAALAGATLILTSPESGSTAEGALGFTAAGGGLAAAAFAGAAAIYAQIRNLWQYAPRWLRVASWVALAIAVITSFWSSAQMG